MVLMLELMWYLCRPQFLKIFLRAYILSCVCVHPPVPLAYADRMCLRITDTNMRILAITAPKALQVLNSSLSVDRAEVKQKDYASYT